MLAPASARNAERRVTSSDPNIIYVVFQRGDR